VKPTQLAACIGLILLQEPPGSEVIVNPCTGESEENRTIIAVESSISLHQPGTRKPSDPLIEAWINHQFIPAMRAGEPGHFRDHTGTGGYADNIAETARISVQVFRSGYRLEAIHVRTG
jgi:hypothetical protein